MPPNFEIRVIIMSFSYASILLSFSFWFVRVLLCSARKALNFRLGWSHVIAFPLGFC